MKPITCKRCGGTGVLDIQKAVDEFCDAWDELHELGLLTVFVDEHPDLIRRLRRIINK